MLTAPQIERLWEDKMNAEARSCYFAELASRESGIKRFIVGSTFILSSAAVVTLLSKVSTWVSILFTATIALANGYQIAVSQDSKIKTAGKLHIGWLQLQNEYDRLWSHTHDKDAESELRRLQDREQELSETAATEIGHNEKIWLKWLDIVHKKHEDAPYGDKQNPTSPTTGEEK
ncbi:hypothetical protein [Granulicella paludicola]|uniref:hypothetical protein n=1 Tax=Granulicella paludicola TaxID=474951 RepID=UPI0021E0A923|nr:hypothetical protein [Granulicella paludicola]